MKAVSKYFKAHSMYNSLVHLITGVGVGIMLTFPYFSTHPVRWGLGLVVVGLVGHLYPLTMKK